MKNGKKTALVSLITVMVLSGILLLAGIILIPAQLVSPEKSAQENISGIGYFDYPPDCGILLCGASGQGVFLYFDFENILTEVRIFPENAESEAERTSCRTDYTLYLPDGFLGALCDRLGGIEMTDEKGEKELFFSVALDDFVKNATSVDNLLKISSAFFEKISKTGLSSGDFMFIIELAETNLPYSVCYDWIPYMEDMFRNCVIL